VIKSLGFSHRELTFVGDIELPVLPISPFLDSFPFADSPE